MPSIALNLSYKERKKNKAVKVKGLCSSIGRMMKSQIHKVLNLTERLLRDNWRKQEEAEVEM